MQENGISCNQTAVFLSLFQVCSYDPDIQEVLNN